MERPRVSVVIPTYNRREMVVEAIESVLAQTYRDFEVIVIDDGSTDGTEAHLQPYLASGRIAYERQENRGVAAARNTGIRLARGELVCFLDSDDLWSPTKLSVQIEFADSHPECALIATDLQGFNTEGKPCGRSKADMYKVRNGSGVAEHLLFGNWIQTSTVMVCKDRLDEVGGFDEDVGQFGEDWLLWMRVASKFPIYFIPEALVAYRFHPERLTEHQPESQFESLMRCLQKLADLPEFQRKPQLLREAEYRICVGRGKGNLFAGEYDLAIAKLKRASKLRSMPIIPMYWRMRVAASKYLR